MAAIGALAILSFVFKTLAGEGEAAESEADESSEEDGKDDE